jgi:predicted nucleotidyltransferase
VTLPAGAPPDGLDLRALADRLTTVEGVVGVVLGGSRARGDHTPDSDVDLGIYYHGDLDIAGLGALARDVAGPDAEVTERGGWGPWVDGGGWLVIRGQHPLAGEDIHVDWLYRDVERVREAWARAHRGAYDWNAQTGHPLGVPDFAYVGELALAVVLADPSGDLTDLRNAITYPDALRAALARNLWEADFLLQIAAKATSRGDAAYIALCLSRAMLLCAHALHAHDRRWLVNEKGAVAGADSLPSAPPHFAERVNQLIGRVGITPTELAESLGTARQLVDEVKWTCEEETP